MPTRPIRFLWTQSPAFRQFAESKTPPSVGWPTIGPASFHKCAKCIYSEYGCEFAWIWRIFPQTDFVLNCCWPPSAIFGESLFPIQMGPPPIPLRKLQVKRALCTGLSPSAPLGPSKSFSNKNEPNVALAIKLNNSGNPTWPRTGPRNEPAGNWMKEQETALSRSWPRAPCKACWSKTPQTPSETKTWKKLSSIFCHFLDYRYLPNSSQLGPSSARPLSPSSA